MTDREKAIVMAHTGICMLAGEKFGVFHAYIEDIMGRPVYTHEFAIQSISDEIKEKSRDDFIKLCKEEQEPCDDAISRAEAVRVASGYCHPANVAKELAKLPPVTPQPKTGHWIFVDKAHEHAHCSECDYGNVDLVGGRPHNYCPNCGCRMVEPQESEDDEQIKVGTKVRTIKDKDFAGEEVFPVETIGIVEEIRKGGKLPYIIRANSDYWYYSRDMFEVIEDIEPQERSDKE